MKPVIGNAVTRLDCEPLFPQTQWSLIQRARDDSTEALNMLCCKYRRPILIWLQGRRRELHGLEPEDLINGFLGLKLQHYVLKAVNPDEGKFRSFVRACLNNYVKDEVAGRMGAVRGGGVLHQPVQELDEQVRTLVDVVSTETSADEAFDRAWGLAILNNAILRLEHELSQKGPAHLDLWKRLQPLLYEEADAPGYDDISKQLGTTKPILHAAACRIRKRLNALIREELRETVTSKQDFDEELRRFVTLLSASSRTAR